MPCRGTHGHQSKFGTALSNVCIRMQASVWKSPDNPCQCVAVILCAVPVVCGSARAGVEMYKNRVPSKMRGKQPLCLSETSFVVEATLGASYAIRRTSRLISSPYLSGCRKSLSGRIASQAGILRAKELSDLLQYITLTISGPQNENLLKFTKL